MGKWRRMWATIGIVIVVIIGVLTAFGRLAMARKGAQEQHGPRSEWWQHEDDAD